MSVGTSANDVTAAMSKSLIVEVLRVHNYRKICLIFNMSISVPFLMSFETVCPYVC